MRGNFTTDRKGVKNPNYKHGLRKTRLFSIWRNIKTRCFNNNSPMYKYYGFREITICDDWKNEFMNFYNWSMKNGYAENLTIDRIDVNGNYEPDNCRWVDYKIQSRNKSTNHLVTMDGDTKTLIEWCNLYEINYHTVQDRLKRGWDIEIALKEPVQIKFRRKE